MHDAALDLTAHHQPRAFADRIVDQCLDPHTGAGIHQRAEYRAVRLRVTCAQGGNLGRQLVDKGISHLVVHDQPLGGHADLALIEVSAKGCGVDCGVKVSVVQHQKRRLAPQLQKGRLEVTGCQFGNNAPHVG